VVQQVEEDLQVGVPAGRKWEEALAVPWEAGEVDSA